MAATMRYLSATDGYLPVASRQVVAFIRNPEQFPLNRYAQYVPAPAPSFWYWELDKDQLVRVRTPAKHLWAHGAKRPEQNDNKFSFRLVNNFTQRYDFGGQVDDDALDLASEWNAKMVFIEGYACQAMTSRTIVVWKGVDGTGTSTAATPSWNGLDNPNVWPAGNIADANALNGGAGNWVTASSDPANAHYMAIRKSIMAAVNVVYKNTNGKVTYKDLRLVVNPDLAQVMANSSEIRDAYKYGPNSKEYIEGAGENDPNYNDRFGLPKRYAGVEIVVEDSMFLNDNPPAAQTTFDTNRNWIKNGSNAVLLTRQGAIDGGVGPSFSTFQVWWWKDQLTVEQFRDPKNRLAQFNTVDEYACVLAAAASGYDITGCM